MLIKILFFGFTLVSVQTFANSYKQISLELIHSACQDKLTFINEKNLCQSLSPYLSVKKVDACSIFSPFTSDREECLKAAANGVSYKMIQSCAQETFSSTKLACLMDPSSSVTKQCEESLSFISEKDLCKKLAADLSPKKVIMCSTFSSFSSDRESCLLAAAQGASSKAIQYCSQKTFSSDKLDCLSQFVD